MSECEQDTASAAAPTSNHNEDGDKGEEIQHNETRYTPHTTNENKK